MEQVRQKTKLVVDNAKHVSIDRTAIKRFCTSFDSSRVSHWWNSAPYDIADLDNESQLAYLFVFNAISFSYWGSPKWKIQYRDTEYDGSWGMIASIARAIESDKPILRSDCLEKITTQELGVILYGNVEIPLLKKRAAILREVGRTISQEYRGSFSQFVGSESVIAGNLVKKITRNFPSFIDEWQYNNQKIPFLKRAQLLVADISSTIRGLKIEGTEKLTACADYKLPYLLRNEGILVYSNDLSATVDTGIEIPPGHPTEIEIRSATIQSVDLITTKLQEALPNMRAMDVNDYLWIASQDRKPQDNLYHHTRTTAY
jgi:hypothetical protein